MKAALCAALLTIAPFALATPAQAQSGFSWEDADEQEPMGGLDAERLVELIEETVRANAERRLGREFIIDPESPAEARAAEELRRSLAVRRVSVNFDKTPFAECVEFLQDITGLNIVVSKQVLEDFGDATISLRLKDVSLRSCLNLLLEQTGEDVRYGARLGVLWIGSRGERKERLVLRFYDVSDIVRTLPDFPGPRLGLKGLTWDD